MKHSYSTSVKRPCQRRDQTVISLQFNDWRFEMHGKLKKTRENAKLYWKLFSVQFWHFHEFLKNSHRFLSNLQSLNCNDITVWSLLWYVLFHTRAVAMFQYSCTVRNLQHLPAARAENYLLYTRIETFSCTTRVKKPISAQRPNGKDTIKIGSDTTSPIGAVVNSVLLYCLNQTYSFKKCHF